MMELQIGIQLYSVRNALNKDFKGTLSKLAELGFRGVEFAFNYGGIAPAELAAFLKNKNLQTIGIYENINNLCDPGAEVYIQADALECRHLTFGLGLEQLRNDLHGSIKLCRKAVKTAAANNLIICYHAHAHEFEKHAGEYYLDILLKEIPEMAFEADTCWIKQGGEEVVGYMQKYADRIPLLHVKDVSAEGKITELGNGLIDFKPVVDFARKNKIPWLSYEQDISDLLGLESAIMSMKYLKNCMI